MFRQHCSAQRQGLTLLIGLTMVLNTLGCTPNLNENTAVIDEHQPDLNTARDISCSELNTLIQNRPDLIIIDVRTLQEWDQGHIPNAGRIDFLEDGFDAKAFALPKDRPIALYCAAGGRSADAMQKMKAVGFSELYNLRGGFYGWEDAGGTISEAPPTSLPQKRQ